MTIYDGEMVSTDEFGAILYTYESIYDEDPYLDYFIEVQKCNKNLTNTVDNPGK